MIGGACLFASFLPFILRDPESIFGRIALALFFFAVGALFVALPAGRNRIVLGESQVNFTYLGRTETAPRQGLIVHKTPPHKWIDVRPWSSWTSFSGGNPGPSLAGYDVFWGPHGLIRGDDLGEHLARWAGTEPVSR
ncbi:hypothetical protein OP10G_0343 [Fimbriimonas ginsengisoli Gsoil 348]|uniref:Uncharacterized protein n=1 Tax=Fimbriimonas ginsengisoli Gsoil 348 TaxID=661478 RepID=A0A068NJN2_FIMGI|nr:hypothetical protein OP10G_0343 [Fimbriimonas ginsengisoli Gsoil 348]